MTLTPYPEYKPSGVDWFGEIPSHWEIFRLKSLLQNINVQVSSKTNDEVYIALENIESWTGRVRINTDVAFAGQVKQFTEGDILFGKLRPYLAKVALATISGVCVGELLVLRPINQASLDRKYAEQLLRSIHFIGLVNSFSYGAKMPRTEWSSIASILVPLPPPDEQAAIVRFLDAAETRIRRYIRAKQKLIKLLNEQKQAIIQQAVTRGLDPDAPMKDSGVEWLGEIPAHWEVAAVRYRYQVELGKMLDEKKISGDYLVPYLRNVDVRWGYVNTTDLPYMDVKPDEYERFLLKPGDMLICEGGAGVGRTGFWEGQLPICAYQKALHRVRVRDSQRDEARHFFYLMYLITNSGIIEADGGVSTIPHLTNEKLRALYLPFPPKEELVLIVELLDKSWQETEQVILQIEEQIAIAREYRTRLIADVVTGKVDMRGLAFAMPEAFEEDELLDVDEDEVFEEDEFEEMTDEQPD